MKNKFSLAMSVYINDDANNFDKALGSVLINQTLLPNEFIIVEDGPVNNDINRVIKKYKKICKENNIEFISYKFKENKGHGTARRKSIDLCTNDLIAIMDADDISVNDRFEKEIKFLNKNKDIDIVGGSIAEFKDDINNIISYRKLPLEDQDIKEFLKYRCPFNQMTVMFKKKAYEKAGGYLDWFNNEDYYLWIRMLLENAKFANLEDTLVNVRMDNNSYKRRGGLNYYNSEKKLQKYMLDNNVIDKKIYIANITKRFIVQVLLPNKLRKLAYNLFVRN